MTTTQNLLVAVCVAGCNLGPRVSDVSTDAPPSPDAIGVPDARPATNLLPAGTVVPSIATSSELMTQIRINDGLSDAALVTSGGIVTRGTGKSAGATVRFWNFGPAPIESGIAVAAPLYVFVTADSNGVFIPLPDHPPLIDTICGDVRYSPIRRWINVPVTSKYAGEKITTLAALAEAIDTGLVHDPVPDGTWVNMPVVLPDTKLEVGDPATFPAVAATQVYGRGYVIDVLALGASLGRQPFRGGFVPIGQASGLQTGVATGMPPVLSTAIDSQPVFQYPIPTAPPGNVFSYSPLATDVTVRLANGVAPSAITSDANLFKRSAAGAITGYYTDTVDNYTVNTTMNNLQLQFAEGSP